MIDCIDDVDDRVAVIVVFRPDGPDPALASEVPELEHGRGQSYLPGCIERRQTVYRFVRKKLVSGGRSHGMDGGCVLF